MSNNQQPPPVRNIPRTDLLVERDDYINICVPLYNASMKGDWEAANIILSKRQELVRFSISERNDTVLHIAALVQNTKFVEELVKIMDKEDLELQNSFGDTPLCLVALAGNRELCEFLVNENRNLLSIPGRFGLMPLNMAASSGNHDTVKYLYDNSEKMTGTYWTRDNQCRVVTSCVEADLFDIALKILDDNPELLLNVGLLGILARKPYAFKDKEPHFCWRVLKSCFGVSVEVEEETEAMQLLKILWRKIMTLPKDDIDEFLRGTTDRGGQTYSPGVLFVAAQMGNTKFLVEIIRRAPYLIWKRNEENLSIFHIAVVYRQEGIYNLLHEIGSMKDTITGLVDTQGNNMLHLVGLSSEYNTHNDVSADVFQMQWELLWFKEVEALVRLSYREKKNADGKTPRQLFIENHKDLVSRSENWMKWTAILCMVVAVLLAGIVYAATYVIPGGYDQNTGYSIFTRKNIFIAFVISNALSFVFSSASFILFTSILSSRYSERDFFESLPQKLMLGLTSIFLSIVMMMVSFSLSFFVLYHSKLIWVPINISVVAVVIIGLHDGLQRSLLMDLCRSVYGSKHAFKPKKRALYIQNPKF